MKISLKNIGKIGAASVEINGITVIAGENNTGKSTVGKTLYCLFTAFHNINDKIEKERCSSVYRAILNLLRKDFISINSSTLWKASSEICNDRANYLKNMEQLKQRIKAICKLSDSSFRDIQEKEIEKVSDRVISYLRLDDDIIKANVLKKVFVSEFDMQVSNVNIQECVSLIELEIHGEKDIEVEIKNNDNIDIKKSTDIFSNLVYIEDPFVVDELDNRVVPGLIRLETHRDALAAALSRKRDRSLVSNVMEEMVVSEKLNHILDILNQICEGSLIETDDSYAYNSARLKRPLALANISTGLKAFLILKTLLLNGAIEEGGVLVLDEPEIHLHPEWQLLFAELIVLIQKEFGVHILLNTHSPYFLNAIEVYAAKYSVADRCKYYLASSADNIASIEDVTANIEKIYGRLARPLQDLENERGRL